MFLITNDFVNSRLSGAVATNGKFSLENRIFTSGNESKDLFWLYCSKSYLRVREPVSGKSRSGKSQISLQIPGNVDFDTI